jgi:hypothetical protein
LNINVLRAVSVDWLRIRQVGTHEPLNRKQGSSNERKGIVFTLRTADLGRRRNEKYGKGMSVIRGGGMQPKMIKCAYLLVTYHASNPQLDVWVNLDGRRRIYVSSLCTERRWESLGCGLRDAGDSCDHGNEEGKDRPRNFTK